MKRILAFIIALALGAGLPARVEPPARESRPLVWIVDGAGDLGGCSKGVSQANVLAGNPVELSVFPWSHGYRKLIQDQRDAKHTKLQGTRLAAKILERAKQEPGRRVIVIAHSAGAAVVLAAGDVLPSNAIDRMILLAPSVSTGYDIRPSLGAAREGIDVFCSKKDWLALGFMTRMVGTVDKRWAPAAGRHGFRISADENRLRHHFWTAEVSWTGHTGGHHGMHSPTFLQAYVFPSLGTRASRPLLPGSAGEGESCGRDGRGPRVR